VVRVALAFVTLAYVVETALRVTGNPVDFWTYTSAVTVVAVAFFGFFSDET